MTAPKERVDVEVAPGIWMPRTQTRVVLAPWAMWWLVIEPMIEGLLALHRT
jgi:hypothetical protein